MKLTIDEKIQDYIKSLEKGKIQIDVSLLVSCPYKTIYEPRANITWRTEAHILWQNKLKQQDPNWLIEYEVSYDEEEFKVIGYVDAFHPIKKLLLEGKTSRQLYQKHLRQVALYKFMLEQQLGEEVKVYIVFIDEKGNERYKIKPTLPTDMEVMYYIYSRVEKIINGLKRGYIVKIPDSEDCKYCIFAKDCRKKQELQTTLDSFLQA